MPEHLTSMALTGRDKNDLLADDVTVPKFPFGLTIHLHQEELEKLGLTELPRAGQKLFLQADVVVESVSESESVDLDDGGKSEKDRSMNLQITDMALDMNVEASQAERIFGKE